MISFEMKGGKHLRAHAFAFPRPSRFAGQGFSGLGVRIQPGSSQVDVSPGSFMVDDSHMPPSLGDSLVSPVGLGEEIRCWWPATMRWVWEASSWQRFSVQNTRCFLSHHQLPLRNNTCFTTPVLTPVASSNVYTSREFTQTTLKPFPGQVMFWFTFIVYIIKYCTDLVLCTLYYQVTTWIKYHCWILAQSLDAFTSRQVFQSCKGVTSNTFISFA